MFIDLLKALVLGIVEGITEFLPISSTGHLIIVNEWLSFDPDFTKLFDIVIQLGAILSVVVYFWERIWPFGKDKEKNKEIWKLWSKVLVGVLPALALGALFSSIIEEKLFNPITVAIMLILGGVVLIYLESRKKEAKITLIKNIGYKTAFTIGLIQCLAMIPGTSRSASTIIGAMFLGASRVVAAEFSFFLAIPTMMAASVYSLKKYNSPMTDNEMLILTVGFVVSFLVAYGVVKFLMAYIQKNSFKNFGYYRIVLGVIVLIVFGLGALGGVKDIQHSDANIPINYTIKNYTVEEELGISCKVDTDCTTPMEYLLISRCPMTAICINKECAVVCPQYK